MSPLEPGPSSAPLSCGKGGLNLKSICPSPVGPRGPCFQRKAEMCLAPSTEHISWKIRSIGHWQDCEWLTRMWHLRAKEYDLFVEVGANIGACTLEMLLSTNASIVAIEPSPVVRGCL